MRRTVVIVQARMASTRLPGKVLLDLGGRTVLSHVLERCAGISAAEAVCCAIPDRDDCEDIALEAARCGAVVFRGSETDVLDRYYQAAKAVEADVILRVTSDCPLVDPAICSDVLRLREKADATYACNNLPPTWPHGLDCEAFPFAWLERAAHEATSLFDREHVGPFLRHHPEARIANLPAADQGLADCRWTLDTEDDLRFLRALVPMLPAGPEAWSYRVPLAIVRADPSLEALNAASKAPHRG